MSEQNEVKHKIQLLSSELNQLINSSSIDDDTIKSINSIISQRKDLLEAASTSLSPLELKGLFEEIQRDAVSNLERLETEKKDIMNILLDAKQTKGAVSAYKKVSRY